MSNKNILFYKSVKPDGAGMEIWCETAELMIVGEPHVLSVITMNKTAGNFHIELEWDQFKNGALYDWLEEFRMNRRHRQAQVLMFVDEKIYYGTYTDSNPWDGIISIGDQFKIMSEHDPRWFQAQVERSRLKEEQCQRKD